MNVKIGDIELRGATRPHDGAIDVRMLRHHLGHIVDDGRSRPHDPQKGESDEG